MKQWLLKIFFLVLIIFSANLELLFQPQVALAKDNFRTQLTTTYTVNLNGTTHVKYQFVITNLTPTFYVKQYAIRLQQTGLTNIQASNQGQKIEPNISETDNQTNIALNFPDQVVGQNRNRFFQIEFDSKQLAIITGKVLEVRIPEIADESTYKKRVVTLITPKEFGRAYRIAPNPEKVETLGKQVVTTFTTLNQLGVIAIFGEEQVFRLNLRYFLNNPTGSPVTTQIALPPTTSHQEMSYQILEPKPNDVKEDADGNWIASYSLKPNEKLTVNSVALAKLTLDTNPNVPVIQPTSQHLSAQPYWEVADPSINQFTSKTTNIGEIYQAVVDTLTYTTEELTGPRKRLGAVGALKQPTQAVCQEYTDLFVTAARNKGIPARRIAGYAVAEDRKLRPLSMVGDVLHSWADYFDAPSGNWKRVDPTWQSTTGGIDYFSQFDLNHIVFAINGESSTLPYPAGFYKQGETPTQDVVVEIAPKFIEAKPKFEVKIFPKKILGLAIPGWHLLKITNNSGQAWYQVDGVLFSSEAKTGQNPIDISPSALRWRSILPYETKQIPIFLSRKGINLARSNLRLSLQLGNNVQSFNFKVGENLTTLPKILSGTKQLYLALSLAGTVVILTLSAGSLLVLRRKKQSSLRGQSQKSQKKGAILSATKNSFQPNQTNGQTGQIN